MVTDLNVAYIGTVYPHHARKDLQEIKDMGCTSINMCLNEADWTYYRFSRHEIRNVAKEMGLKVFLNLHGFGMFASTFPGHMYQMKFPQDVQVSNHGITYEHFACPNNLKYRAWLSSTITEIIEDMQPDGIFWDEPRFDTGQQYPEDWSCYCLSCRQGFEQENGIPMPTTLTDDVLKYRQNSLLGFLREITVMAKELLPTVENILCLMPKNPWGGKEHNAGWYGVIDWEPFVALPSIDVFATDPYWIHEREWVYFEDNVRDAVTLSQKYEKPCQIWVQSIWIPPGKEYLIGETIHRAEAMGADRIAVWAFRGESGSHALNLGAVPDDCWAEVVKAYKEITVKC